MGELVSIRRSLLQSFLERSEWDEYFSQILALLSEKLQVLFPGVSDASEFYQKYTDVLNAHLEKALGGWKLVSDFANPKEDELSSIDFNELKHYTDLFRPGLQDRGVVTPFMFFNRLFRLLDGLNIKYSLELSSTTDIPVEYSFIEVLPDGSYYTDIKIPYGILNEVEFHQSKSHLTTSNMKESGDVDILTSVEGGEEIDNIFTNEIVDGVENCLKLIYTEGIKGVRFSKSFLMQRGSSIILNIYSDCDTSQVLQYFKNYCPSFVNYKVLLHTVSLNEYLKLNDDES